MTREYAIAKLKNAVSFALGHGHMVAFLIVPDVVEIVRMLESLESLGWIRVQDRLPAMG